MSREQIMEKLGLKSEDFEPRDPATIIDDKLNFIIEYMGINGRFVDSVFIPEKTPVEELPSGDYLNPIVFEPGMYVDKDKFYTDGDNTWECVMSGYAMTFTDPWFEVIG